MKLIQRFHKAATRQVYCRACSHVAKNYADLDAHISKSHPKYSEDMVRKIVG